jgi:alpha-galactosidase
MLAQRPPLGWNSWNTFGERISEALIHEMADCMVEQGYLQAGYEYLVIDDCWSLRERDENGLLVPDPTKFPCKPGRLHGSRSVFPYGGNASHTGRKAGPQGTSGAVH